MSETKLPATQCGAICHEARGYKRHHYRGEEACAASKAAYAADRQAFRGGRRVRDQIDRLSGMSVSDCIDEIARVLHG